MRIFTLLLLLPFASGAQNLSNVKKIIFEYGRGGYLFGDTGRYHSGEIVEFVPVKNGYRRTLHTFYKRHVPNPATGENTLSVTDTAFIDRGKVLSAEEFQTLITELNTIRDNFTKDKFRPYLPPIKRKEILDLSKQLHKDYLFFDEETGMFDRDERGTLRRMKRYLFLDTFLQQRKPLVDGMYTVITDSWNRLRVSFCEDSDTTKFDFRFHNFWGQPYEKMINQDFDGRKQLVNSTVNRLLVNMLPRKSITRKAVGFEAIKKDYLRWCLDNSEYFY